MSDSPELAGFDAVLAEAAPLARRFEEAGFRLYLVGGIIRDQLLGIERAEQDLDATTDARPDDIKRLVAPIADAMWTQGERFGTIGCQVAGRAYEITTHRAEVYDDESRKPIVTFGDSIDEDLSRRDFTVNAIAVDLSTGMLVDPFGGRDDLAHSVLRTPLDPEVSFSDDPLRMLRAARFHAGYELEPDPALPAAIEAIGDRMSIVSVERIRDELQKTLLLEQAGAGLRLLHRTGLLGRVIRSLEGLTAAQVEVVGRRVEATDARPAPRWAALLLDVADPGATLEELKPSGALAREVGWLIGEGAWVHRVPDDHPALRRAAAATPPGNHIEERLDFVATLRSAAGVSVDDIVRAREGLARLREVEPDLDAPVPVMSGERVCELLDLSPGPEVGMALGWLANERVDHGPQDVATAEHRLLEWWADR